MTGAVKIVDVTLRDGLQLLTGPIRLEDKLDLVDQAWRAGLRRLELGSFVSPKRLPQFADTAEVIRAASRYEGLTGVVLVPNAIGYERAVAAGAQEVVWVISASEAHNQANLNRSVAQSVADLRAIRSDVSRAEDGPAASVTASGRPRLRLAVATAFHCPFEGATPHAAVLRLIEANMDGGDVDEVVLADTIGHAYPHEVSALVAAVTARFPALPLGLHAHDTLGRGIANIAAAFDAGVRSFDGAFAGLGGCPYAPGASGNVSTEDANSFFVARGIATGLDADGLARTAAIARRFGAPARVPA